MTIKFTHKIINQITKTITRLRTVLRDLAEELFCEMENHKGSIYKHTLNSRNV